MFRWRHHPSSRASGRWVLALLAPLCASALAPGRASAVSISAPMALSELSIGQNDAPKSDKRVRINIVVIEASKKEGTFDARIKDMKIAMPGYQGARIVDELKTEAGEGSSVSLEIMRQSGQSRVLQVTVKKVESNKTVLLRVAIDALKFSSDTKHEKGGTFVVHHPLSADKGLFLAVTPTVE